MFMKNALLSMTAVAGLFAAYPAVAQTKDTGAAETIIVTAQRRSEQLQDVPITITNLSTETLKNSGAVMLTDIAQLTPGLRFDARNITWQPSIRGVGTLLGGAGLAGIVGVYFDGFYAPSAPALSSQLLN